MSKLKIIQKIRSVTLHDILIASLKFVKHYFGGLIKRIDEHNLFLSAAGISYSLFLSVIPIILIVFSILGNLMNVHILESQVNQIIETIIPYPKYAEYARQVIATRLPEVIEYKTLAGYLGFIGLIFTSTWIFSSMRTILNQIFHTKIQKSAFIGLLRDVGMVILLFLFITIFTFLLPAFNIIIEEADSSQLLSSFNLTSMWDTVVRVVSIIMMFGMLFLLFYLIPYEKLRKRVALLSAFWTTALWEVARNIFGYYVRHFLSTSAIYGAFVLIVVILFWVFYSSCIFIVGAEIGQLYRERRQMKYESSNLEAL